MPKNYSYKLLINKLLKLESKKIYFFCGIGNTIQIFY
jgi:hypothetical protein